MRIFYRKTKHMMILVVVLAMLVQMLAPVAEYVHAEMMNGEEGETVTEAVYGVLITGVEIYDQKPTFDDGNKKIQPQGNKLSGSDIRLDAGAEVAVIYDWKLPADHGYKSGDTFTFDLPEKLKIDSPIPGNLFGNIGTYLVSTNKTVTFTFNEEIEELQGELEGYFYVWVKFDLTKFDDGLEQKIDFSNAVEKEITIHFNKKNPTEKITKKGTPSKTMNPDRIDWVVDFNLNEETINNAVFKDTFSEGLTIDLNSVEVRELIVNTDGSLKPGNVDGTKKATLLAPGENGFQIDFGNISKAYRVSYSTTVEPNIEAPYNRKYENNVVVSGDESELYTEEVEGEVKFSKPLDKISKKYYPETQKIDWEIRYNFNEQTIPSSPEKDWHIKDEFHGTQILDGEIEVFEVTIKDDGNYKDEKLVAKTNYTIDTSVTPKGFELKFNNVVTKAYVIRYSTKSENRVYDESIEITNIVSMDDTTTATGKQGIGQYIFHKSNGTVDYARKEITWTIYLNRDNKDMENVVITDNYEDQNMELIPGSMTINGSKVVENTDYTLSVPDGVEKTYKDGFKLKFTNTITESQTIVYKTKFDSTKPVPQIDGTRKGYKNTATLNWSEEGTVKTPITKVGIAVIDSYTKGNGNKTGKYNAKTKEITWTIDVNYNLHDIKGAIVEDTYTGEQTFVEDSLEVYNLILSGGADGVNLGDEVEGIYKVEDDPEVNQYKLTENGFILNLGGIKSAYRITYKTSLAGKTIKGSYTNNAKLTGKDGEGRKDYFEEGTAVTPANGEEYIRKSGTQGSGDNADIATWTVGINYSQSHIDAESILTDTLSDNQILLTDSFKIYTTVIPEDNTGKVTKESIFNEFDEDNERNYEIKIDENNKNKFTLTFKKPVSTAYILEYKSFITAGNKEKIRNNAEYRGETARKGNDKWEVVVSFAEAGGGATIDKQKLKIKKIDDEDKPLSGAVFELYNKAGTTLLETLVTDEKGEATTTNSYKYNSKDGYKYILKEISAPKGYLIDNSYRIGKEISFKGSIHEIEIANTKIRQAIELTKIDSTNAQPLQGVEFKLLKKDEDGNYNIVSGYGNLTTNEQGKIYVGDLLEPGDYQLIEINTLDGYWLDENPVDFKVKENQTVVSEKTMTNTKQGDLIVEKIDKANNNPLAGAVFILYDSNNKEIATATTGPDGKAKFANIKYGTYKLNESKAPIGYVASGDIDIIIELPTTNKIVTNEKIYQAVELIKVDSTDANIVLEGAVFTLHNADTHEQVLENAKGEDIGEIKTNKQGRVAINNLEPGDYYFEEVTAPDYYLLPSNTKTTEFTIDDKQTTIKKITAANARGKGSIIIKKVDVEDDTVLLEGVVFKLTDKSSIERTGATGENGTITFDNLPYDTYTIKEITPHPDYVLNLESLEDIVLDGDTDNITIEKTVTNTKKDHSVILTKYGGANKALKLKGAIFELRKANEEGEYEVVVEQLTTNENGEIKLENLEVGKYQLIETKAPAGYRLDKTPVEFEIEDEQTAPDEVEKINYKVPPVDPGPGPEEPEKPEKPTEPPTKPEEPEKPTEPEEPEKPTEPTEPEEPEPEPEEPTIVTPPENGTVEFDEDGNWKYTPNPEFKGKDKFVIRHPDGTEELIEIDPEDIPLGTVLPKTGEGSKIGYYITGLLLVLLGLFLRRKIV